jgi:hypothetical protein
MNSMVFPLASASAQLAPSIESEERKRQLELKKLDFEAQKAEFDAYFTWWIGPLLTAASIAFAGYSVAYQTRQASKDREKDAQKDATLKLAEFVMNSRQPAMARERLRILSQLDKKSFGTGIADTIGLPKRPAGQADEQHFPAVERSELKLEVFRSLASQPGHANEILRFFASIYPNETWITDINSAVEPRLQPPQSPPGA